MKTVREQILDAVEAKLRELEAEVGATVETNTDRPEKIGDGPLVIMVDGDDEAGDDAESVSLDLRSMTVEVEGYVAPATAPEIRAEREKLLGDIQAKMMEDRRLGGLVIDVLLGDTVVARNTLAGHPFSAAVSQTFVIAYATAEGDPFTLGPA